jgi:hypothetical protein
LQVKIGDISGSDLKWDKIELYFHAIPENDKDGIMGRLRKAFDSEMSQGGRELLILEEEQRQQTGGGAPVPDFDQDEMTSSFPVFLGKRKRRVTVPSPIETPTAKQEDVLIAIPEPVGFPIPNCDDPTTVFVLLKAKGLGDAEAWKGVGDMMLQIQATTREKKLSLISAYSPLAVSGPGFVLGVLLDQEPMSVVLAYLETFTESLGTDIPDNKEEIFELFSRHRQVQDQEAPILPIEEDERFPIPSQAQQMMRCCALNMDLVDMCQTKFNDRQFDQSVIRKWFTDKPERLEGTGLTVEELSVVHIVPSCLGGISYVYNYALVPTRVNSKFRERFDAFKRMYLGRQTIGIALEFATWVRVRADVPFS